MVMMLTADIEGTAAVIMIQADVYTCTPGGPS